MAFLAGVLVLMMLDKERGPWIITTLVVGIPTLIGGWFLVRKRVLADAEAVPAASERPDGEDIPVAAQPDD